MVTSEIIINGQNLIQPVVSITITKTLHEESLAVLAFKYDPSIPENNYIFGDAVDISLGYNQNQHLVFSGVVAHFVITLDAQQGSYINLICNQVPQDVSDEESPVAAFTVGVSIYDAHLEVVAENEVHGNIQVAGNSQLQAGASFSMVGFGALADGTYIIQKIIHDLEDGNWLSTIYF